MIDAETSTRVNAQKSAKSRTRNLSQVSEARVQTANARVFELIGRVHCDEHRRPAAHIAIPHPADGTMSAPIVGDGQGKALPEL